MLSDVCTVRRRKRRNLHDTILVTPVILKYFRLMNVLVPEFKHLELTSKHPFLLVRSVFYTIQICLHESID